MNPEHVKKLWQLRFEKIVEGEKEAFEFYKKILKEKSALLEEVGIKSIIKQIMRDEANHIRIAQEMLHWMSDESKEENES